MRPAPSTETRRRDHPSTLLHPVARREDRPTRRRPLSPIIDHRTGHQPPMPTPNATSPRKKSQSNGQPTIPLPVLATDGRWKLVKRHRHSTTERSPVNPSMEGRCYHCLARDHQAQTCQEPVLCRLCRQAGHRQYACPRTMRKAACPEPPE